MHQPQSEFKYKPTNFTGGYTADDLVNLVRPVLEAYEVRNNVLKTISGVYRYDASHCVLNNISTNADLVLHNAIEKLVIDYKNL